MFLVELWPGKEVCYRTAAELRAAIHQGEIVAGARIFHRTNFRWIPITKHPEYQRFEAERDGYTGRDTPAMQAPPPPPSVEPGLPPPRGRPLLQSLAEIAGWASIRNRLADRKAKVAEGESKAAESIELPPAGSPDSPESPDAPDQVPTREEWTYYPRDEAYWQADPSER